MANYNTLEELLNTNTNMECIRNNSGMDEGTDTLIGADWFIFNQVVCTNIYVNANHFIGLESPTIENVKVCRRDGKVYSVYREEGTILNFYRFIKIRWEGYTKYDSTSSSRALIFEFFLFDTGNMFLNVIQHPTDGSYIGYSELLCGSTTYALTIGTDTTLPIYYSFYTQDTTGSTWSVVNELMEFLPPYDRKYLLRSGTTIYTVVENSLSALTETTVNAALFETYGVEERPSDMLIASLTDPELLYWMDTTEYDPPVFTATVTGVPMAQTITTNNIGMTDETILGIESVAIDSSEDVLFAISFDHGATWMAHNGTEWITLSEQNSGMTASEFQNISLSDWASVATTGHYKIRFTLALATSYVRDIIVNYINS